LSFQPDILPLLDNAAFQKLSHIDLLPHDCIGASGRTVLGAHWLARQGLKKRTRSKPDETDDSHRRFRNSLRHFRKSYLGIAQLHTDNPHAQPSTRLSILPTIPQLHNLTGVYAFYREYTSPWSQLKFLARKMSTDASSSTRPKRQLVKAACQSCQKRKVKVRTWPRLNQWRSYIDHKAYSAAASDLCVCSVNREANRVSTTPKQAYHESKLYDAETRN
jgi:hypothetical protein